MKDLVKALSLGATICLCMTVPTVLGVLADRHLGTAPVGVLIGVFVGLCSAFWTLKELIK
ncbi:MAG: AtpZ/AtpI family protein [Erysipelotrichaceae bacterium]|nr:AtpZ/AtpI family protein [Erysipelotrichaceae bacterium]